MSSPSIRKVRKRDGRLEDFDPTKIVNAIFKALKATGEGDYELAKRLGLEVVSILEKKFAGEIPSVEEIQDIVEDTLIRNGLVNSAKAYILYRRWRTSIRETKRFLGVEDDLKLTINAVRVLARRYLLRDESGRIIETPGQMFMRVAKAIARADSLHGKDPSKAEKEFFQAMRNLEFLPNSPTLMNAGTEIGQLAACFVIPVEDSIEGIFDALKYMAIIHKSGGGCVAKGTFIYTTLCGVMPIEHLVETFIPPSLKDVEETISIDVSDREILVMAYEPHEGTTFRKLLRVWRYSLPRRELVKVSLANGVEVVTSSWHPFLVLSSNGEVVERRADELKPGDLVLTPTAPSTWPFKAPIEVGGLRLTEDLAWALGYTLSRVSLSKRRARVFSEGVEPLRRLKQVLSGAFGRSIGRIRRGKSSSSWIYQTCSTRVVNFFKGIFGASERGLKIPQEVFKSPLDVVLAFIAGLIDSQGRVSVDEARIEIIASGGLGELLPLLLSSLGLNVKVRSGARGERYRVIVESSPTLRRYASTLLSHMVVSEKKKALRSLIGLGVDAASLDGLKPSASKLRSRGFREGSSRHSWSCQAAFSSVPVKVVERLEGDERVTLYDLTVDGAETYVAGVRGFVVVHNTGFSFSRLRPKGDIVKSTMGVASGPVSFMKIFDVATEVIKQGGKRRGANMGVLRVDHPDVREFITVKGDGVSLRNFNISVAVTDDFMEAAERGSSIDLINPRTGEPVRSVNARDLFELMVDMAWRIGDPGLLFIDEINRKNPTPKLGVIEATNPCVSGDTRVLTPWGYLTIRDVYEAAKHSCARMLVASKGICEEGDSLAYATKVLTLARGSACEAYVVGLAVSVVTEAIAYAWRIGKKRVVRVKTREGYELVATPDHKVMVEGGWRRICDLQPGDKVVIATTPVDHDFGCESIGVDLAFALGWLVGRGSLRGGKLHFHFSRCRADVAREIADTLAKHFKARVKPRTAGGEVTLSVGGRAYKFFSCILAERRGHIPEAMYRLNPREVAAFLRGLFGALGFLGHDGSIRLRSEAKGLLREAQDLLLLLGVKSRIHELPLSELLERGGSAKKLYELIVSGGSAKAFAEKVGVDHLDVVEVQELSDLARDDDYATVDSIEELGEEVVYDLTVPELHSYVSNGFISHNCGEVPLLPFEACNLGSINLSKVVEKADVDWDRLRELVWLGVHFLDNVIDVNKYPIPQIERMVKLNRKIGLGVMGFADMLLKMGIPYDSEEALKVADEVMSFIAREGKAASRELALERGVFPTFEDSRWRAEGYDALRNATVTSIAPTGTISIIAGTSSSIEPIFAPVYVRKALGGVNLVEVNPIFERVVRERGIYSRDLIVKVAKTGSLREVPGVPEDVKRLMATALDVDPEWHVKMQAAFQKHVDNAVAKTVNLRHEAGLDVVRRVFKLAYKLKCKGITVYRYGSKPEQVLYVGLEPGEESAVTLGIEYLEQCPRGVCFL